MGEGGRITLVNSTNSDWKKTGQHSYQMNDWNFPDVIKAKTSVVVYIEWNTLVWDKSDDAGEVYYALDGTSYSFQIQARADNGFHLQFYLENIRTLSNAKGSTVSLGWKHDGYVSFVLSGKDGSYSSTGMNGATWMQSNLPLLGTKKLSEICITGSHDSGMSVKKSGTAFAFDCNVLTQSNDIFRQLKAGARYFDIRPVISGGSYYTGHYGYIDKLSSWQGANGQSIQNIIQDINAFATRNQELIVLNLSHSLNTDLGNSSYRSFTQEEWNGLFKELSKIRHLYKADANTILTSKTLNDFISSGSKVLIILEDNANLGSYAGNGFFKYSSFNAYNSYAEKNQVDAMAKNQFDKMKTNHNKYFLLSWTLTQDATQASTCALGTASSIKELAGEANERLADLAYPEVNSKAFPNIIYTDDIVSSQDASLAMAFNWKTA